MDFVLKELIFLAYCWLSLGAFGGVIEPFPENKAVLAGTTNVTITCSVTDPKGLLWNIQTVGTKSLKTVLVAGDTVMDRNYFGRLNSINKSYTLIVILADSSMAGIYGCVHDSSTVFSQLIVLNENPSCDFAPKETKQLLCNETLQLSCSVRYAANEQYVVASMKWSTDASSSESLNGAMDVSTLGNITTATSTLSITWPVGGAGAIPIYSCITTFSLIDGPSISSSKFVKKPPDYYDLCKPFTSRDDVPCIKVEQNKDGATTITPDDSTDLAEKSGDASDATSIISSDTNIVRLVLCVAGSLLMAEEFGGEMLIH